MTSVCAKCGSSIESGQRFCTKCGAPAEVAPSATPKRFCTQCGGANEVNAQFCTKCGKPLAASVAAGAPQASLPDAPVPVSPPLQPPPSQAPISLAPAPAVSAPPPAKGNAGRNILVVLLLIVVFFVFATVGSFLYIGYRAKKKVDEIQQAYKRNDVGSLVHAVTGKGAAGSGGSRALPSWKAAPADLIASPSSKVPLQEGLTVVTAINQPLVGDYESIKSFDSAAADSVHMRYSAQMPSHPDFAAILGQQAGQQGPPQPPRKVACSRTILRADLESSAEYREWFCQEQEEKYPGSTAISISKATLNELKTSGTSDFKYGVNGLQQLLQGFKKLMNAPNSPAPNPQAKDQNVPALPLPGLGLTPEVSCTLHCVEANDLAFPVLVNNQRTELPTLHAACKPADSEEETNFYFLDDPDNPLALAWQQGETSDRLQVIKLTWPPGKEPAKEGAREQPSQQIAQQLATTGRAQIYGIYFDFASDALRPESEAVLKEISQVLADHPDWKLSVEGHTDNIGGDAFNMDLSQRRAAAVKQALVTRYHIAPDRLSSAGFGATRPVESNDTMEGRARNRRVELVRQ
jgi:outer membrane protein OmpA-like peptidoglycan-associated protein